MSLAPIAVKYKLIMELDELLSDQKNKKQDQLNLLLTDKIGYGHAQQKLSRSLYLLLFSQGCETIVLGLLLPILSHEWSLSTFQKSMLITAVYFGVAIGSYLQIYSDKYGRYAFIFWDTTFQTAFGLISCFCWSFQSFLFARFFYGIGIGICLPLSASYITQISPGYMRATLLAKSRVYWSGGCLFTCFAGWFLLKDNHWRVLLFVICLPGIYALIEYKLYGKESLRYLWVQKRTEEVHQLVTYMCQLNYREPVSKQYLLTLMEEDLGEDQAEDIPLSEMFNHKYSASSLRLLVSWFSVCFIYYGIMILLPTILQRVFQKSHSNPNFKYMFLVAISMIEVAGFFLSSKLMDHPKIGRKKGVYYGLVIIFCVSVMIIVNIQPNFMMSQQVQIGWRSCRRQVAKSTVKFSNISCTLDNHFIIMKKSFKQEGRMVLIDPQLRSEGHPKQKSRRKTSTNMGNVKTAAAQQIIFYCLSCTLFFQGSQIVFEVSTNSQGSDQKISLSESILGKSIFVDLNSNSMKHQNINTKVMGKSLNVVAFIMQVSQQVETFV